MPLLLQLCELTFNVQTTECIVYDMYMSIS